MDIGKESTPVEYPIPVDPNKAPIIEPMPLEEPVAVPEPVKTLSTSDLWGEWGQTIDIEASE